VATRAREAIEQRSAVSGGGGGQEAMRKEKQMRLGCFGSGTSLCLYPVALPNLDRFASSRCPAGC